MKANFGLIALAVVALAATGCVDRGKQAQAKQTQALVSDPSRPVTVAPVRIKTMSETLSLTGEVTTSQDAQIGAKRSGRLTSVLVNDGDSVKTGQLLATLDNSDIMSQLQQALSAQSAAQAQLSQARLNAAFGPAKTSAAVSAAQSQLRSAQAQLKKARAGARPEERIQVDWQVKSAKSNLDTTQKDLDRKKALVEQGAIAKSQLDVAQNAYMAALTQYNAALQTQALTTRGTREEDIMIAQEGVHAAEEAVRQAKAQKSLDGLYRDQIQTAQAQVDSARAQVNIARQALTDTQVRAPFSGRVAGKSTQVGTVISPGQTIVRLIGAGGLYFEGDVPESSVAQVQAGRGVVVKINAIPGRTFNGYVANVSPLGQDVGRLFRARIQISGDLTSVRPGMFASGDVLLRSIPGAMVVPISAVVPRDGKNVVFVVNGNKARQLEVKTGLRQGNDVQVTGLVSGQEIVVRGQEDLVDGALVKIDTKPVAVALKGSGG
ncbi:MAG: hypothetical protein QOJ65_2066 [Fimbriimonadaceae bacterium]|jgi:RND family efflux transporter MFP subunit|nr:hypothetical protein [Fimbriimonadaceae bacterium]